MKTFLIFLFSLLLSSSLIAQNIRKGFGQDSLSILEETNLKANFEKKSQFHLSMGGSLTSFNNNTLFSKWVAPEFSYQINPKLNLHIGTMYLNENFNINSYNSENQQINTNRNFTRAFVYLSGDYQLNKNIRLRATTLNEIPVKSSPYDNYGFNQFGFDLKITDNLYMSADFISIRGRSPVSIYSNNPFYESTLPFGRGAFNTGW